MKWVYILSALYGGIVIVMNAIGAANVISNPSDLPLVDAASVVSYLMWIGFGVVLMSFYFVHKKKEDLGVQILKPEPNSPEDTADLEKKRNWIIGLVILSFMISSVQTWILNDYTKGFTLINADVIFDLAINVVFAYLLVQLFRNKKVLHLVLIAVVAMVVVEGVFAYLRLGWLQLLLVAYILPYFIYAIRAPLNRSTFRIAHVFLLPAVLIAGTALTYISNTQLNHLLKTDTELFQQYGTQNGVAAQAYQAFLQKNIPTVTDIKNVKDALEKGSKINKDIAVNALQASAEFEKELPNVVQKKELYHLQNYQKFLELNDGQAQKINEFMDYAATLDFNNISQKQALDLSAYKSEVDAYNGQIQAVLFKMSNDLK